VAGTVVEAAGDRLVAATGDGLLQILQLQPEGRRVQTSREFLAGHRVRPGMQFDT
jgi:methionyl-tRNA formyltransferase